MTRILLLVELKGGNDGLNTVIPYADDAYHRARSSLGHDPKTVLKLDDYIGLHPNLAPLMNLNNLGAFAALGAPLWVGLTYRDANPNLRLLGYVAVAITTTTAVLSLSRGAIGEVVAVPASLHASADAMNAPFE